MDSLTKIKNNIILIYSVCEVSKICRYFLNFAPTFVLPSIIFAVRRKFRRQNDVVRDAFNAPLFEIRTVRR
jgi:hypothetical protein